MIRKNWKYLKYIVIPGTILAGFGLLYQLTDFLAVGVLADWFDRMFMYENSYQDMDGTTCIVRNISWPVLKSFLFSAGVILILILSWTAIVISDIKASRNRRKHSQIVAEYLHRFILDGEPQPLELPQEEAAVFSKIAEIRLELSKKEMQLREESARKDDLVTYLAHDLKTPLTSVIGYLSFLQDEPDLPAAQRAHYTAVACKKAERLEDLTNELLEITRFNLSHIELKTEEVNLSRMLEQIASEFEPMLTEKQLSLKTDIAPDISYTCDVDKIERVIDNLIRNAINYSYPDSEIGITLTQTGETVRMQFRNRGRTIPKEVLERIFEQFYRMDSSRNSRTGGSGLGLAIAKQLVEAHGGSIAAESEHETIRFAVTLPVRKS